jgi:hypothetical protein
MVASKDILPLTVRATAVGASIACRQAQGARKQPYIVRRSQLTDLINKHRVRHSDDEWWSYQFLPIKD